MSMFDHNNSPFSENAIDLKKNSSFCFLGPNNFCNIASDTHKGLSGI